MSKSVEFSVANDVIGIISVDRADYDNVLNLEAMESFAEAVEEASNMPDLRVLVVTSAGQETFICGVDLEGLRSSHTEQDGLHQYDLMAGALLRLSSMPIPVIAAVEGTARGGGCEVALACDLRVAADDATFTFDHVTMGLTPGWGGTQRLFSLVGYARAMDLLLTSRTFSAIEALALGFIDRNCRPGDALKKTLVLADTISQAPPLATKGVKQVLRGYLNSAQFEAREQDRAVFGKLWASHDHVEASEAIIENRPVSEFRGE